MAIIRRTGFETGSCRIQSQPAFSTNMELAEHACFHDHPVDSSKASFIRRSKIFLKQVNQTLTDSRKNIFAIRRSMKISLIR